MSIVTSRAAAIRRVFLRGSLHIGVFSAFINVLMLVSPLYMLQIYDRVLPSSSFDTLIFLSIIAVAALIFLGLFDVVRSFYAQRMAAILDQKIAGLAFAAALTSSKSDAGDIAPLRNLAIVRGFIASKGLTTLFDLPFAPFFMGLLFYIHPVLFWITLAGAVLMILLVILTQLANQNNGLVAAEQVAMTNLFAQAFVRNEETLKAMGMSHNAGRVWGELFAQTTKLTDRSANLTAVFAGISRSTRMLLQMAILGIGAILVLKGEMTAGMIFASSIISGRALQPFDQLVGVWKQLGVACKAWALTSKMITTSDAKLRDNLELPVPTGRIAVRNLAYILKGSPSGTEPVLKNINLDITAGESIAIIGPSRAGKSTLARLLVNAIQPSNGTIKLDGSDLRNWNENQLGSTIGYLAQDVQLLPGTIAENVSRFDPDASDKEVVAAALKAQVHELILSQPLGYQTRVGSFYGNLSGGERQRIGLARAFYENPKLLVLDEPNASLDSDGEAALERALRDARADGTTVIIISHRTSIISQCDKVLMLRAGRIEAFCAPHEILRKSHESPLAPHFSSIKTVSEQRTPANSIKQAGGGS
ncbi:type I secretion system permease/ATPase [Brucella sp. HL-2]|nr:type I secretion system permease/ATPase [Brucella sp. HL-2]MCV9910369.1 type I secretion system permease/ATPase [Brucella sp. HL-2]